MGLLLTVGVAICLYARAGAQRQKFSEAEGEQMMTGNPLFALTASAPLGGTSCSLQRSLTASEPHLMQPSVSLVCMCTMGS